MPDKISSLIKETFVDKNTFFSELLANIESDLGIFINTSITRYNSLFKDDRDTFEKKALKYINEMKLSTCNMVRVLDKGAYCKLEKINNGKEDVSFYKETSKEKKLQCLNHLMNMLRRFEGDVSYNVLDALCKLFEDKETRFYKNYEEARDIFNRLNCFVRDEKSYFEVELINPNDLNSVICVRSKLDNPHIIRQNGAFFLFGMNKDDKSQPPEIPNDFIAQKLNGEGTSERIRFIIPSRMKNNILKELELLSISEGYLFSDIDKVANDVKRKYK